MVAMTKRPRRLRVSARLELTVDPFCFVRTALRIDATASSGRALFAIAPDPDRTKAGDTRIAVAGRKSVGQAVDVIAKELQKHLGGLRWMP